MSEPIDRQTAIDAIRASASKYTGFMEKEMYTDDDAVKAIEAVPTASPWHRVEEPPKPFETVIAYVDPWHIFAAYHNGHGDWKENDGFNVIGVTHWMPIEPPQEVQDADK